MNQEKVINDGIEQRTINNEQEKEIKVYDSIKCLFCSSLNIVKRGFRNGKQKYWCKKCNKVFVSTNNTSLFYIHQKSYKSFSKFLECLISDISITDIARICGVSTNTIYNWKKRVISQLLEKNKTYRCVFADLNEYDKLDDKISDLLIN